MPLQNPVIAPCVASLNSWSYYLTEWAVGSLGSFPVCSAIADFRSCLLALSSIISLVYYCWFHIAQFMYKKCFLPWVAFKFIHIEFQDFSFLWTRSMLNGSVQPLIPLPQSYQMALLKLICWASHCTCACESLKAPHNQDLLVQEVKKKKEKKKKCLHLILYIELPFIF